MQLTGFRFAPWLIMLAALTSGSIILGGCAAARAPSASLIGAVVEERTEDVVKIVFDLEMTNPNPDPVQLLEIEYEVSRVGRPEVFRGRRAALVTVSAGGQAVVRGPAILPRVGGDGFGEESGEIRVRGRVSYRAPGWLAEVLRDAGLWTPSVRFGGTGQIAAEPVDSASAGPPGNGSG